MKAIVQDKYGSPDVLKLTEVDKPAIGNEQVLVQLLATGVGPDVWHLMSGLPHLVRVSAAAIAASGRTTLQSLRGAAKIKAGQKVLVIGTAGGGWVDLIVNYSRLPRLIFPYVRSCARSLGRFALQI